MRTLRIGERVDNELFNARVRGAYHINRKWQINGFLRVRG